MHLGSVKGHHVNLCRARGKSRMNGKNACLALLLSVVLCSTSAMPISVSAGEISEDGIGIETENVLDIGDPYQGIGEESDNEDGSVIIAEGSSAENSDIVTDGIMDSGDVDDDELPSPTESVSSDALDSEHTENQMDVLTGETEAATENNRDQASDVATYDSFSYQVDDENHVHIVKYNGSDSNVVIPDQIAGKDVTVIDENAFKNNTSLETVQFPEKLVEIGCSAFSGCNNLEDVNLPEGLKSIGFDAFTSPRITSIIIPKTVEITSYNFFSTTTTPFSGCPNLLTVIFEDGMKFIPEYVLWGCKSVKNIVIPEGVESIRCLAFGDCTSLKEICLPKGMKQIDNQAFQNCRSLVEVDFSKEIEWIGFGAFEGCSSLETVQFPEGLKGINSRAFFGCDKIKDIQLPEQLNSIGYEVFSSPFITSITIPKTIEVALTSTGGIGNSPFSDCLNLETIIFENGIIRVPSDILMANKNIKSLTLPEGVVSIGSNSFFGCISLEEIHIPESTTDIGIGAFDHCNKEILTIYGYQHSYAETYAKENGIQFVAETESGTTGGELDYTKYQADYTQVFQEFMTDRGTFGAVKMMVKNENWPAFNYIYTNDQKIGTYITATITNVLFRFKNLEGGRDLVSGEISQQYAREVLLALMDQKESEVEALVKAREAQNMAKKISDGFDHFLKITSGLTISSEDRAHLENFFHSETIDKKLEEGKYSDLINMCHLNGYENSSAVVQTLKLYQESSEFSKIISDTLGVTGKALNLAENANNLMQLVYRYKVTTETNQVYIDLLTYIRDQAKFAIVSDAAADIVDVLNTNTNEQWKKITAAWTLEKGEEIVISKLTGALDSAIESTEYGKLIARSFKLGVNISNKVFGTANYQEKYDNMRVLAYLGDAIGQWTIGNYNAYFQTSDTAKKNDCARKAYYGLKMLLKTRQDGEEVLQGLWTGKGEKSFNKSWYYQTSVSRSALLKVYEEFLFTREREKTFYATAVACPVDVEVYNTSGVNVLTIKDGQETPFTMTGDIAYTEYLNPGTGEYDKVVLLPKDAGYSLKCVGTGLGTMNLHTMDMSTDIIIDKILQNVPVTPDTTAVIADPSGNNGTITLITDHGEQKTALQMKPQESIYVPVAGLTISADNLQMKEGETSLVSVQVEPENATDQSITWSSGADEIAAVNDDGVVTGKSAGKTTLTISAENGQVTRQLTVTVLKKEAEADHNEGGNSGQDPEPQPKPQSKPQPVHTHSFTAWTTSSPATVFTPEVQARTCSCGQKETRAVGSNLAPTISLNAGSIVLKTKQRTNKLKVSGLAAGDSVKSWKSSNSKIVKVNGKGVVTAGTKAGKAKLTVTLASGFKKTIAVKVQKNAVAAGKITGLPKKLTLKKGMKVQLKPAVQPITCVAKVRYKSSNGKAVKVSGKGYVTAKKKGKSTITVQCGRKKAKIKVTVK